MQKNLEAFIFDMDGTLIDNMMVHHRAWQQQMAIEGFTFSLEQIVEKCHGKNVEIIERLFGDKYSPEERLRFSNDKEAIYRSLYKNEVKPIDGLISFLKEAKAAGIKMGIGTAAQYANVNFIMDTLDLRNYFEVIVADVDVTLGKPNPEVFLKVAKLLMVNPENCVVFEDSPVGAKTAENAAMPVYILTTTHAAQEFSGFKTVVETRENYLNLSVNMIKNTLNVT
jgi:beta-phosphoglucomutase